MLDFNKMRDPVWQAEVKAKQEMEQAAQEKRDGELRNVITVCEQNIESLAENERGLVRSCRHRINTYCVVSEKQEAWLRSIAQRF